MSRITIEGEIKGRVRYDPGGALRSNVTLPRESND